MVSFIAFATPANVDPRTQAIWGILGALSFGIALVIVIFCWNLFRAPYRQRNEVIEKLTVSEQEIVRLTGRRLLVSLPESYYDYLNDHWIRLRVENPTAVSIPDCYGKSVSYRLASYEAEMDGKLKEVQIPTEVGTSTIPQSMELPPQRHRFPWSTLPLPEITTTIPTNSYEFLYIAMKRNSQGCFYTPTDMGLKYPNYGMGNFELEIEIGSNSEPFKPTKVRLTFCAGEEVEVKKFELLPD